MELSRHAQARMQQRCIPLQVVELLNRHGRSMHSHGARRIYFDKRVRKKVLRMAEVEKLFRSRPNLLDTYMVQRDGLVITVAYRKRRFRR